MRRRDRGRGPTVEEYRQEIRRALEAYGDEIDVDTPKVNRRLDAVEAPWSLSEEKQLRAAWERNIVDIKARKALTAGIP